MSRRVVIDANRIFSELIAENHQLRRVFASEPESEFFCPKYVLVELFTKIGEGFQFNKRVSS